jgi:hypothetical protein
VPETLAFEPEDTIPLLEDIETTFGIRITDAEAERCRTFGDLYDVVADRSPEAWRNPAGPCSSLFVFNRLRRFSGLPRADFRPDMPLAALFDRAPARLWLRLARGTGLRLPTKTITLGQVSLVLVPIGLSLALAAGTPPVLMGGLAIAATGLAFFALDRRTPAMPVELATVGAFVERIAAINAGRLAAIGIRPPSLWSTLAGLVLERAERTPLQLDRSTLLLHPGATTA